MDNLKDRLRAYLSGACGGIVSELSALLVLIKVSVNCILLYSMKQYLTIQKIFSVA